MDVLPCTFRSLLRWGVWSDDKESESFLRNAYRMTVITVLHYITITEIIELLNLSDVNDLTSSLFLTLSYVALCLKWLNFIIRKKEVNNLLMTFRSDICQPHTPAEKTIVERSSRIAGMIHNLLVNSALVTASIIVIRPMFKFGTSEKELPFKTYQPYDTSKSLNFYISYVILGFAEIYGAVLNGCFDTVTIGFILLASGQFELCSHRLKVSITDSTIFSSSSRKKWINHHVLILEIVREIQSILVGVLIPLFSCILIVLCTSIFQLYQKPIFSMEFLSYFVYLSAIMFEAFLYCWSGFTLTLKGQDVVNAAYVCDWTNLQPRDRKYLLMIMRIGQKGTTISYRGQVTLSLQTFSWIIKTSYGAFNILKGVSEL